MHTIKGAFEKSRWFKEKDYKYIPLEKYDQIDNYYKLYFEPVSGKLDTLYSLLENATEALSEIIATLYAVWNNRIIRNEEISNEFLIQDFYSWSDRKQQYTKEDLIKGLATIRENGFEPNGFGKELKRAKK